MTCVYVRGTGYAPTNWNLTLVVFPRGSAAGTTVSSWEAGPTDGPICTGWE